MAGSRGKRVKGRDVLPLLSQLVDKSLVVAEDSADGQRYRLSETAREYLRELFGRGAEASVCRERHRKYFRGLAVEMEGKLLGDESQGAMEVLGREHDNLRLAIDNALHGDPVDALVIAGSLWRFWSRHGLYAEGRGRAIEALERTEEFGDTLERAKVFHASGSLAWTLGELDEAEESVKKGLAIYQAHGDLIGSAACMIKLGNIVLDRSDLNGARTYYTESLAIYRQLKNLERISTALNNLGILSMLLGDYEAALTGWKESMDFAKQAGVANALLYPQINIAELYLGLCEYDKSNAMSQEVLKSAEELGEQNAAVHAFLSLGNVAYAKGEIEGARTLLEMAVREAEGMGDLLSISEGRTWLSLVYLELGMPDLATDQLRRAMHGFQKLGGKLNIAKVLGVSGAVLSDPRLWVVADRVRDEMGVVSSEHDRRERQRAMDRVRAELGESRFEAALREGGEMSLGEAVAAVLGPS